jgi:hypothetical protein
MEEMMQKISIREKLEVQRHHVPLILEKEKVTVPHSLLGQYTQV